MAGSASTDDLCMIDSNRWQPCNDAMTIFANRCRLDVRSTLTRRVGAVVATSTIATNIDVIEIRGRPRHGRVTIVASLTACNVGWSFAGRNIAIVAGLTGANNLRVVH